MPSCKRSVLLGKFDHTEQLEHVYAGDVAVALRVVGNVKGWQPSRFGELSRRHLGDRLSARE
jgi:hypothetical protein